MIPTGLQNALALLTSLTVEHSPPPKVVIYSPTFVPLSWNVDAFQASWGIANSNRFGSTLWIHCHFANYDEYNNSEDPIATSEHESCSLEQSSNH